MAFRYLSDEALAAVRDAVTDLGLVTDGNLAALTAGISPAFVGSTMVGPNPSAKLLTLNEDDTLGVGFLLRGAASARSVAKLKVHRHFDGAPTFVAGGAPDWGLGTGWMIGPGLLITNYHVINARTPSE